MNRNNERFPWLNDQKNEESPEYDNGLMPVAHTQTIYVSTSDGQQKVILQQPLHLLTMGNTAKR